ncbi:hypothetical protein ACFU99_33260, partial [Streptomyces sp. NPDC057654]|uniref:hypothetical protein n=1 Tax=Streptomyces sp. NPDC057654 TaxID=3346196 RepID=UPI0036A8FF6B
MSTSLRYPSTDRRSADGRTPEPSAPRPFDLGDVARFSSPLTRMLLASDGLTTTLLESALRTPLRLRVLHQGVAPAAAQDALVRRCLGVGGDEPVLVRRSATADAELTPVGLNRVVGVGPDDPALAACVRSARTPIGYGLRAAGAMRGRRLVEVGVAGWERDGRVLPAVFKSYVVLDGDLPWLFIRELFNPLLIPAGRDGDGRGSGVAGRAQPLEARVVGRRQPRSYATRAPAPMTATVPRPAPNDDAFWLQFGGQATGALLAAAAGLVRYATGV